MLNLVYSASLQAGLANNFAGSLCRLSQARSSRDPVEYEGNAIGLYGYCHGRSLSAGDPTGNLITCWTQSGYGGLGLFGGGGYLLCMDDCACPGGKRNVAFVFCGGIGVGTGITVTGAGAMLGAGCLRGGW